MSIEEEFIVTSQSNGDYWVKESVHIKHIPSGEIRIFNTTAIISKDDPKWLPWMWEEGNWSCDCNRSSFFSQAAGEDEYEEAECGDELYRANVFNPKTGECLYREYE